MCCMSIDDKVTVHSAQCLVKCGSHTDCGDRGFQNNRYVSDNSMSASTNDDIRATPVFI